jgi:phosphoribosylformylglycinamidine synthase
MSSSSSPPQEHHHPKIIHYYRQTEPPHSLLPSIREELQDLGFSDAFIGSIQSIATESCFNVLLDKHVDSLTADQTIKLEWLLAETFQRNALLLEKSALLLDPPSQDDENNNNNNNDNDKTSCNYSWVVEFGPRLTFTSAFSSNAVSICQACDLPIARLELSQRYQFVSTIPLDNAAARSAIKSMLHDRMTQQEYTSPLMSLDSAGAQQQAQQPVRTIAILKEGRVALERLNAEMGLGFDDFDLDYYTQLFKVCIICHFILFVYLFVSTMYKLN